METHKRKLKNFIKSACFLLIFATVLDISCWVFEKKDSIKKRKSFYEKEQNIDVIVLGTSLVLNSVFPMELWNDYGIAAYNYAGHAEMIPINYWNLVNALNYTNPKLVVIDVFQIAGETKVYEADMSYLHMSIDAMPFSLTKIQAVNDLVPEGYSKFEYLFDFALYHSRWEELSAADVEFVYSITNGSESRIGMVYSEIPELIGEDEYIELDTYGVVYLEKIIQLCQERGIDCLLINLPYSANNQQKTNYAQVIADQYGIRFCNMMQNSDVINYATDFCDGRFHLNPSGAVKVSEYLGNYIVENYNIPDRRQNPEYSSWEEEYQNYKKNGEFALLRNCSGSLYDYLILLYDKNIDYYMCLQNKNRILRDESLIYLLENLGINVAKIDVEEYNTEIVVRSLSLKVENWEDYTEEIKQGYDIEIISYDAADGNLIDHVGFKVQEDGSYVGERIETE